MAHKIIIYTDWDFSVEFKGVKESGTVELRLNSLEELDEIKAVLKTPTSTKDSEFNYGIARIKANPDESFFGLLGNRGVSWYPNIAPEKEFIPKDIAEFLILLSENDAVTIMPDKNRSFENKAWKLAEKYNLYHQYGTQTKKED